MRTSSGKPPVICLLGPTASGKTAVAVELVQQLPLDIISVDSAQIYRGLDIGTGKPDAETLRVAPHRLIDILDPAAVYSAADFRRDALREINSILGQGRTPLLVGGTMLYFKALRDGLAALPEADPVIRDEIEQLAHAGGWEAVHAQLALVDPAAAARIHPNDPQRLQRALEVYRISGRTMSQHHAEERTQAPGEFPFQLHFLAIQPGDRRVLHDRIAERFRQMLAAGFESEVASMFRRGDLSPALPSIKSVGYRQMWAYLSGEIRYDEMVEKSIIATRQLAKRQLTWLRSWQNLQEFEDSSARNVPDALVRSIRDTVKTVLN